MESLFELLVLLICYPLVSAQFPIECRSNSSDSLTKGSGICCPLLDNEVCGGSRRGQCSDLNTTCSLPNFGNYTRWLLPYFSRLCVCQPAFSGAACEQCAYGFTATLDRKNCVRSSKTRIRRDFLTLSPEEQGNYRKVLQLMKNTPSSYYIVGSTPFSSLSVYDYFAAVHYICTTILLTNLAHDGPGFPTWHRAYLLHFERQAQTVSGDPTFTLPYVNEYNETAVRRSVDLMGGDGLNVSGCHDTGIGERNCSCDLASDGPYSIFSEWQEISLTGTLGGKISRALGCERSAQTLPLAAAFEYAIGKTSYSGAPWNNSPLLETFSNLLEGYARGPIGVRTQPDWGGPRDTHNRVHIFIGGTMKDVATAASDPFFWLHHSFIDMMLEKWMRKHPTSIHPWTTTDAPPGHSYNDCQALLLPLLSHANFFSNSRVHGYTYDQLEGKIDYTPILTGSLVVITLIIMVLVISALFSIMRAIMLYYNRHLVNSEAPFKVVLDSFSITKI